jgi:hypothetical protein
MHEYVKTLDKRNEGQVDDFQKGADIQAKLAEEDGPERKPLQSEPWRMENMPTLAERESYIDKSLPVTHPMEPEFTEGGYPNPLYQHDKLSQKAREIMMIKNHDYTSGSGDPYANFRGSTQLGISNIRGILLRVQDKMMRIRTFDEKGELKVKDEGVEDAVMDVINYMVLISGLIKEMSDAESEEA